MRWSLLLLLIAAGCGLMKNKVVGTDKSSTSVMGKMQTKLTENVELKTHDKSLQISERNVDGGDSVKLWPKGVFTYSLESGFSGEADSLIISRKVKTRQVAMNLLDVNQVYKGKTESSASENMKQVSNQVSRIERSSVSWKWIMTGVVLLVLVWWYRK